MSTVTLIHVSTAVEVPDELTADEARLWVLGALARGEFFSGYRLPETQGGSAIVSACIALEREGLVEGIGGGSFELTRRGRRVALEAFPCKTRGHTRQQYRRELPAPCLHGRTEGFVAKAMSEAQAAGECVLRAAADAFEAERAAGACPCIAFAGTVAVPSGKGAARG